jgi:hypothetical protein
MQSSIFYTRRHATVFPLEIVETKTPFNTIDIDFDESSQAWRSNKQHMGGGVFKYTCSQILKTGKNCCNKPKMDEDFCRVHTKTITTIKIVPIDKNL